MDRIGLTRNRGLRGLDIQGSTIIGRGVRSRGSELEAWVLAAEGCGLGMRGHRGGKGRRCAAGTVRIDWARALAVVRLELVTELVSPRGKTRCKELTDSPYESGLRAEDIVTTVTASLLAY